MADRSRRERKSKLDKLAEYKRAREGGTRVFKEEDVEIYDEVSEDQYQKIVKGRLQRDDFVVDDGAEGYVDNGMDDWAGGDEEFRDDSEEEGRKKDKKKKNKTEKPKAKPKPPPPVAPSINAYRPAVSAEQEADFMASLLGNVDNLVTEPLPKPSRKRKPSPEYEEPRYNRHSYRRKSPFADASSDGPVEDIAHTLSDDAFSSPNKRTRTEDGAITPAAERLASLEVDGSSDGFDSSYDDINMDDFMDMDDDFDVKPQVKREEPAITLSKKPAPQAATSKLKEEADVKPAWLSVYDSLAVESEDTLGPLSTSNSSSTNSTNISALEEDGSLRFFWIDYMELDGLLYFIGKLKEKTSGTWISCCVKVEGIKRNLFVLPREKRVEQDEEGNIHETDIIPTQEDIDEDFDLIRKAMKIKSYRAKFVKRKYAFGEQDIPRGEAQWMKVIYGFNEPVVPMNAESQNIARILGTNTSAFELLVLKRKIMGPCWITIKNPQIENTGVSWCKLEVTVADPKDFNPFSETDANAPKEQPPLNVMSLCVRTVVNHQENKREVVCATARIWHNMQIDDATPPEKLKCTVHTFVRPLDRFPTNFEREAKSNAKGTIMPMKNERMLLSSLLVTLHKADPDIIVGHDFLGVSLDVLLNRMRDLKVDHWSRLGRFRRSRWPNIGKQGSNLKFLNGRLLCDLASDGAKSMIASTTWTMTEMCKTHLNIEREDFDPDDTASKLDGSLSSPEPMLKFVRHCELDAHFQMAIASKVQILPLTKQLTNLAGNSWNKTLNGGRAERNEYILLHEFHRLKYICPDKTFGKKSVAVKEEPQDDDEQGQGQSGKKVGKKRDKYKGGLVFEPKRGLWDKFILVMDFNSLYPSIIQEYNIDFTTVEPVDDDENGDERIPEPPSTDVSQGVLPRLIATLVNRRRQVKSLMKDRSASAAQLLQYDIKQQALKLTANSMYGCLGFEYSRFYARPLAALTTHKGREILTHTKELAESLNLEVVYGDTDSVFVNSNVTDLAEALKISALFKKAVNDRYKLLEIDLDGVFQRLLLLQKKKYAALKVDDGTKTSTEIKGLDMKRREYCALSKQVSQYVLEQILSGEATENVVENIHEYLTNIGESVRSGSIKMDDYIIFKRLGKNPEDYPDAKSQPHVQVALRIKQRGGSAKNGDVIPYIFCLAEGEESSKTGQADRAKHPDELRKAGSALKIDYDHYLSHQILPPIERLCDPIEGTDRARLAECLGLDPMRYRTSTGVEERVFSGLDSQMSDAERFRDALPFIIRCRHCQVKVPFLPLNDPEANILQPAGPLCPSCTKTISLGSLLTQLEIQIRESITKYYQGWTVCDDPTCNNRTRMMGVYGRRCLRTECKGRVSFEYTDTQLYNQLRFYVSLFDTQKALDSTRPENRSDLTAIITKNQVLLRSLGECVEKHLNNCGRRWIDLGTIFSSMKL
ncbi:DNA polymerase alpha catalytic subunit [Psilocybe cubensis]|uniref:DNA polymerase alpha catalytic subunit n=2 Tax=Psilocybe cubensis TaxID=181762 RepID=A0ACB8GXV4_PSICU|nr:DNA polymerase alpha catalytic subunit [Psilocybe cubensis]KAH9479795.1 DNA polymerase alpha catalytic subunit [Psilocybe cubensis]